MRALFILLFLLLSLISNIYSQDYLPGDNELLLMPTAYTMPVKNSYFSNYEIFLLNYSYAITSTTHLGVFSLFPVTTRFYETLSFGIKQKFLTYESLQSAFYGTYTPKSSSFSIGNVLSIGKPSKSLHASIAYIKYTEESDADLIYMLGVRLDASEKVSFLIEYENANSGIKNEFSGLISIGVRIRSTNMSWEIAGIRPLASTGDLLFIPLLKVGYYFN